MKQKPQTNKKKITSLLVVLTLALSLFSTFTDVRVEVYAEPQVTLYKEAEHNYDVGLIKSEIVRLVNEARAAEGLKPLKYLEALDPYSDLRASEINQVYDHVRPDGSSIWSGFEFTEFNPLSAENIHKVGTYDKPTEQEIAKELVDDWLASEGHRANILSKELRNISVGIAIEDSIEVPTALAPVVHAVQLFTVSENVVITDESLVNQAPDVDPEDGEDTEEPVDPEDTEEPVDPEDTEEPVDPEDGEDTEEPVDPEDTEEPVDPEDTEEPVDPEDTEEPVDPEDTEEPVDPEDTEEPVDPEDTEEPVDPEDTEEPVDPEDTEEPVDPEDGEDTEEPVDPEDGEDTEEPVDPEDDKPVVDEEEAKEEVVQKPARPQQNEAVINANTKVNDAKVAEHLYKVWLNQQKTQEKEKVAMSAQQHIYPEEYPGLLIGWDAKLGEGLEPEIEFYVTEANVLGFRIRFKDAKTGKYAQYKGTIKVAIKDFEGDMYILSDDYTTWHQAKYYQQLPNGAFLTSVKDGDVVRIVRKAK